MKYDSGRALELLRIGIGTPDGGFRPGQEEAIRHVVRGDGRLLVVQKTGWGKSFVYFISTKLLRDVPGGLPRYGVMGRIPEETRANQGRALCV